MTLNIFVTNGTQTEVSAGKLMTIEPSNHDQPLTQTFFFAPVTTALQGGFVK